MDLLMIEGNEAYFQCPDCKKKLVSQVTPNDINSALGFILRSEEVGLGLEKDAGNIVNPAQKIIFEQLRTSFKEVYDSRTSILNEVDSVFAEAESKYCGIAEREQNDEGSL